MMKTVVENFLSLTLDVVSSFEDELKIFFNDFDSRKIRVHREMIFEHSI